MESKCWSCARCRDLPDPAGCVKTRTLWEQLPEGIEVDVIPSKHDVLRKVINCPQYERTNKQLSIDMDMDVAEIYKDLHRAKDRRRKRVTREQRIKHYTEYPRKCGWCGKDIAAEKRNGTKYCNAKCCKKANGIV